MGFGLTAHVRGAFSIVDEQGTDLTPAGHKEKAVLAMLAFAPGARRPRKWLQQKLWSDRFAGQSSASLRRALYQIRKRLGDRHGLLGSDRDSVWLTAAVRLDRGGSSDNALLEDIAVSDPAYLHWLRDLRYGHDGSIERAPPPSDPWTARDRVIRIVCAVPQKNYESHFLARAFADSLATRLHSLGAIEIEFCDGVPPASSKSAPDTALRFELESALANHEWFAHLRIFSGTPQRFLWSGRLRLPMDLKLICDGPQVANFIGRAITAMRARLTPNERESPYFAIQQAAEKVFLGDRAELELADRILDRLGACDAVGVARAWRGYVRLTWALEFGDTSPDMTDEAVDFIAQAMRLADHNPLVAALGAQVHLKLCGDLERSAYLAGRAVEFADQDPFALHSLAQVRLAQGDYAAAHAAALTGKAAAGGLSNAYCWDMQCCLSALGQGRMEEAMQHAARAHLKMPGYRPALRYLLALGALLGRDDAQTATYTDRLRRLEPGFLRADLLAPEYPLDTLRLLGLGPDLAAALAGKGAPPASTARRSARP